MIFFCSNRLEEIGNYRKVRRIKQVYMEIRRIRVWENGRLRTCWTKGENKIKYEGVEE